MTKIRSTESLKNLLRNTYLSLHEAAADPGEKVAWCSSVGPAEILVAMGFHVYFPENHGAILGARKLSQKYIQAANSAGYSPEICSYLTSDVGSHLLKESPLEASYGIPGPPKPDVLVYSTSQCREIQDWFAFYSREYKVPSLGIFPPNRIDVIRREDVEYTVSQLQRLTRELEGIRGKPLDPGLLREAVRLSCEASKLWTQYLEFGKIKPSPITFFDACIQMAPIVIMRGREETVEYYRSLNEEIRGIIQEGNGVGQEEACRFYWEGMPVWGKLRFFTDLFRAENSSIVASTYCNSWRFDELDPEHPFESMAESTVKIFINRSETVKQKILADKVREYAADAVIFHDAKTCPHNTNSRYGLPERLKAEHGIPSLTFHGDLNDMRCFSDDQTVTIIQAFLENFQRSDRA